MTEAATVRTLDMSWSMAGRTILQRSKSCNNSLQLLLRATFATVLQIISPRPLVVLLPLATREENSIRRWKYLAATFVVQENRRLVVVLLSCRAWTTPVPTSNLLLLATKKDDDCHSLKESTK